MFNATTFIGGTMIGTRESIGHVDLIRIMQALIRAGFRPEGAFHQDEYRFITYRTPDEWSADLMVSVND